MKKNSTPLWHIVPCFLFVLLSSNIFAATFTVTNLNNSGIGSLRQAIIDANAGGAGPHTINFAVSGTIPINSSLPAIANAGITIDGGGNITINAQGGDIDRRFFIIQASNTTVKGFTLQNTGTYCFDVATNLSNVTIQDIVANHVSAVIDNVVLVTGNSTNMTIKNVMVLSGMQECAGSNVGRPFYFQNGTQTNLTIEDVTAFAICEGVVFRDAGVNGLNMLNTTLYGGYNEIVFDNSGGPVETANNVVINGENTASLYSQRDGAGSAMIYSDFINTNWSIKNLVIDNDRANSTDDANYGIRFDNTTNGITIDSVTMDDAEVYGLWFNGAATNIAITNSSFENFDGWVGTQMIRFESTVTTLNITNTVINLDQTGTTDDGDYGIVFGFGVLKSNINITGLTMNEADIDGIFADGPVTNFTLTNSTFTNNFDGIEFYNAYNHSNLNITNSTFTGHGRTPILINTGSATNSGTISGNTISNNTASGLWFYSGDGAKSYTVTDNTISFNGGAGIYVNAGPDRINITQNSIFRNTGNGIELDGGGNLSYEGANRPTVTGSTDMGGGMWKVNVSLPTICNAAGGCTVEIFANNSSDDVEGRYFVQSFSGLAGGSHVLTVASCTAIPCTGFPYGFWTSTLKVAATGSVSEFSNKQTMKTQGPAAVDAGVALWLDAQDALSGNLPGGTGWQDRSGNDRDFDLVWSDPNRSTGGLNYNHYVQFDGDDYFRSSKSPFVNGFTAGEVIVVTRAYYRHVNQGAPYDLGGSSNSHYTWGNDVVYNDFGTNPRFAWNPSTNAIAENKGGAITSVSGTRLDVREWNIFQTYSAAGAWGTGFNGQFVATTATNTPNFTLGGGNEHIGAVSGWTFYGDVAEVIMYSRTLTTTERARVNSYLALKYGTTLNQTTATNYVASDGTSTMWVNDGDAYRWNIFGIGRDNASGLQQKQSESIEQNAILSVAIGDTIASTNEANTATIATDKSFLTFADNNQLQRFGPAVTATNSNFRMHRTWKVDKFNFADANVTFQFGADFGGNYLLIAPNDAFSSIASEILLDSMGRATFSSSLLGHGSFFTVGAKMQLPGCVSPPVVSYPNYQEHYNPTVIAYPTNGNIAFAYGTNPGTQFAENSIIYGGYYDRNFTNAYNFENNGNFYRARLTVPNNGSYTFYLSSDDNGDLYVNGDYVASVYTCCYTASGAISLPAGTHDIEVRQTNGGGAGYVTVEYAGPSISRQVIPVTALSPYTAPGVQTWLKADQGVVNSGGVTRWNDASGNNNDAYQVNASFNPTYNSGNAINFNPAVSTAGGQGLLFKKTIPPTNNLRIFAVGKYSSPAVRTMLRGTGIAPTADHFALFDGNTLAYFDNNNVGWKYSGQTATTNVPYLIGMSHNAAANTAQPRLNGRNGTVLNNINEADVDYFQHFLNAVWQGSNQPIGDVAEFVAVSGMLSATDIQKIESYLALKYGITIDQTVATNYLATTGTMWVNDGDAYKNDIAGIGKDLCQNLHQKQSKSVNADDPITIAVGDTIMPTNATNPTSVVNDLSFLTWANNDGNTTNFNTTVSVSGVQATTRIARIWKVDKTNWNNTPNLTINFQGANAQYYLLISNDPTFATGVTEYQLNAAGNRTFPASALAHGAYFTFGKRVAGPACVNEGIRAWYRADVGATATVWTDFSGNENNGTKLVGTTPVVNSGASINFNPSVTFVNGSFYNFTTSIPISDLAAIGVGMPATHANFHTLLSEEDTDTDLPIILNGADVLGYWDAGFKSSVTLTLSNTTPQIFSNELLTASSTVIPRLNGRAGTTMTSIVPGALAIDVFGNQSDFSDQHFGTIGELVLYNKNLTTTELQRINSYLALKYGITLDQTTGTDYVANDGTIYWNDTDNTGYNHDITGIGRDDCTNLYQKQSRSANADDVITGAAGTSLAVSNAANAATITNDKSFFVWANNNGATTFSTTVTGFTNATTRMARIWKVDKTNFADQNITICASQAGERYMLLSADATFGAGDVEKTFNFGTGCVTLNSSEMPDGSFFTIATKITGPACVNTGIALWMRADYNGTATSWSDFSGNNRNTTGSVGSWIPQTTGANFNPYLDNGAAAAYYNLAGIYSAPGIVNTKIFTVALPVSGANNLSYSERTTNGDNIRLLYSWSNGLMYWDAPFGYRVQTSFAGAGGTYSVPNLFVGERSQTNMAIRLNGRTAVSNNAAYTGTFTTGTGAHIGADVGFATHANNRIAEVVVYKDASLMTPVEIQRIESYLALKYGITLNTNTDGDGTSFELLTGTNPSSVTEGDYVASNGTTIYWDASLNTGYNSNVAGIGRDDCTDLNQKQSKSVNTGEVLTGALGSAVATSNVLNTNTITTDNSYFVWGHNNGLNEFTTQVVGTNVTAVLGRVWRVDRTGTGFDGQNITLCFDNYNDDDYLVISNTSGSFATINHEKQLSSQGCVTFSSADLPDGAYFSLGKNIMAPGCVTGGIVTWLDAQTVASGNMIDGVGWADQSGNSKYFNWVFGDPARSGSLLNYNYFVNFDGNDYLRSTQSPFVNNFTAAAGAEVLVVTKSGGQFDGQGNPYDFGAGSRGEHYSWGNSHLYNSFGTNDRLGYNPENNTIIDGKPGVASITGTNYTETNWNLFHTYAATNDWGTGYNGLFKATTTTNTASFALAVNNEHIGDNGSGAPYNGDIAEVVLYRRKLTALERQKVMSYLALKYGMTLDTTVTNQDYIASDSSNIWDWSDNNNYQHDIAGIGREDCQKLNQKQSKSINGDDPLAIAAGNFTTFPISNEANTTTITNDKSFLTWGNNNGALTFTTAVPKLGINGTFRTPRAWKIDKTNFANQMLTISVAQTGERYLLVDEDGSGGFENDANTKEYAFSFTTGLLNLNASALPDGAVIALATKISGPACVNAGINVWLRADYGGTPAIWTDFSGNNRSATQGTLGNQAVYASSTTNFNPGMQFNGSKYYDFVTGLTSTSASTFFFVSRTNNTSLTSQALAEIGQDRPGLYWDIGRANNYTFDVTTPDINHPTVYTTNDPTIFAYTFNNANPKDFTIGANGLQANFTGVDGTYSLGTGATGARLGAINFGGGNNFNGDMNEVVVYSRVLTNVERQQVESYLALKYGITLSTNNDGDVNSFETISGSVKEGDYVASNGTTIYWDGATNTGYNSNVAGIGLDICTELSQKQSRSVNVGEILTGALGSAVAASNATNTTAFADSDLSFLVWGNNNGTNDFNNTVTATGTTSMAYLGRVWRAQKTNFSNQNITLCFTGYDADEYLLISNSSATFATVNQELQLDANGCITFSADLLPNGAYFTLGKNIQGPACVDGGIKLWLRADDGSVADSLWADYSGNGRDAAQTATANRPVVTNNVMNFNPGLVFDGTNDFLDVPYSAGLNGNVTVFTVHNQTVSSGFRSPIGSRNAGVGVSFGWNWYYNGATREWWTGASGGIWDIRTGGTYTPGTPDLLTFDATLGSGNSNKNIYVAGRNVSTVTNGTYLTNTVTGLDVGSNGDPATYWNGSIVEQVVYSKVLTATERQRVNSYLALKYGITIDQTTATDYLASDGSFMWEAGSNTGYGNDIAGLGKDECTNFHQKQSKSVNSDALITMALGASVATTNQSNPNTVTNDKSFLVWSNNNLAATFSTAFAKTGSTINLRTPRTWKVDKTNWIDQDITICVSQTGERSLIIDNGGDANFADDAQTSVHALDFVTGCVTISSSLLPDGAHFSLGTEIKGPACVDTGVRVWLRGDYGAGASSWIDFSGNNRNATVSSGTPGTGMINFNSTPDLPAGNVHYSIPLDINPSVNDPITVFTIYHADVAGREIWGNDNNSLDRYMRMDYTHGIDAGVFYTGANIIERPIIHSAILDEGLANGSFLFADGRQLLNYTTNLLEGGLTTTYLGRGWTGTGAGSYFDGRIAEFAVYQGALTNAQRQNINSYFALKYGITLTTDNDNDATAFETISGSVTEGDYVASNGTTIYWDASANSAYHNNVAGIGRDSCTNLLQKQSKSVNTGEILTVALGSTIQTSNALNTSTITADRSFLVWGHNNGSTDFLSDAGGTNATARMNRVWRVQKTNWTNQSITLKFDGYDEESYLIIHATDPTFATTPLEYQLNVNGEVTLNTSDLPDGAFFTLGKNLVGPACVDGGIKMWLRADDGTATGAAWSDFSGNALNATQGTMANQPSVNASSFNFNPALDFNGTTHNMLVSAATLPTGTTSRTAFVVASTDKTAWGGAFSYGGNTATTNVTFSLTQTGGTAYTSAHNGLANDAGPAAGYINNGPPVIQRGGYNGTQLNAQVNGGTIATRNFAINTGSTQGYIGTTRFNPGGEYWDGEIAEVIIYNKELTAAEAQRVNSYLAFKYGITLDQTTNTDYIASDAITKMWENDNDAFEHDIAGIGKDDCTSLHQKQSTSVNADDVVAFAMGSHAAIPATNVANTTPVTNDLSFFSWANDNGNTDVFSTAVTATNAELRMARVWKVDKFNWQDQDITICFDGQIGERYLLIDNNSATLASIDQEIALNPLTGCATFNSSELGHGFYFSLGTKILGPGCADNNDILTWLRADYGASSTQWNDFSGRTTHARQTAVADTPTIAATSAYLNFNPALDFDGGDFMNFDITGQNLNINPTVAHRDSITVLMIYHADNTSRPLWGNDDNSGEDRYLNMHNVAIGTGNTTYTGGNVASQSKLVTAIMDEGATNGSFVYADGSQVLNFTQSGSDGGLSNTMLGRSRTSQADGAMFDGRVAEFAVYRGALSTAQRQQAESYLAIKYGITLSNNNDGDGTILEAISGSITEGDYVASNGTTVIWDASDNATYHNDIAGIGRDTCTALNQKQSRSANSDDIVTLALGSTVAATNVANTNSFTNDLAFLLWGNNNGTLSFNTTQTGTFVTARLGRTWKVQKSANWDDAQDVTLCFTGYDEDNYLLVSDVDNFATLDLEQALDANGCITINSALLENGDFFTLGADVAGPACVNVGIAMWLRADDGSATGAAWNDQSGNDVNASQGTGGNQATTTGSINFNPALLFDGGDDFMSLAPLNGLPYNNSNRTIVSVGYSSNTVGSRWIFSYGTNTASDANFWGQQGTTGNYGGFSDDVTSTGYWTANIPNLTVNTYNGANATIAKDGRSLVSTPKTWTTIQDTGYIGRQVSDTEYWQGGIGEVVVYNRLLTALELQQVHSYLALKYGLTLTTDNDNDAANFETLSGSVTEGDYVASDGTTIYWDASVNTGYNNNIAGIGVDSCTNLIQKQSKSSNASANTRLTGALGTIAASNALNTSNFSADKQFLVWGDDNATFAETSSDLPTAFAANSKRFTREWKVDRTGTPGNVQLQFDLSGLTVSGANINEFKLLIDRDGDGNFATGTVDLVDASAYVAMTSVTFNNVSLLDGDVFTLASELPEISLSGKVLLQGAYNTITSLMNTGLNMADVIPMTDPYGLSTTATTNPNTVPDIVDWVKIEIRDATFPTNILKSVAAFVKADGTLVDINGSSTAVNLHYIPGTYHIAIHHRNHLGIRTSSTVNFTGASATGSWDFTTAQSQAYQDGAITTNAAMTALSGGKFGMWGGNANANTQTRYSGPANDPGHILSFLGGNTSTIQTNVYADSDVNLNGIVRYSGPGNDLAALLAFLSGNTSVVFTQHL